MKVSPSGALHAPVVSREAHVRAWMSPDKKKKALLYISDYNNNALYVYSYPKLKPMGTVTSGLSNPDGICNDKKGNIWVDDNTSASMVQYAHGGTSPKATLSDPGTYPVGCSVDPATGNLAVSNIFQSSGGAGNVAVYAGASGSPTYYSPSNLYFVYFVGYDNKGNLYADGENESGQFELAELTKGSSSFSPVSVTGGTIHFPGNIRWDGKYITVGDQEYNDEEASAVNQLSGGAIVGTTVMSGALDVVGYTISKKTLIGPDASAADVGFYKYPAGGSPKNTLTGFSAPYGSAISK